jgi:hypothetical protein
MLLTLLTPALALDCEGLDPDSCAAANQAADQANARWGTPVVRDDSARARLRPQALYDTFESIRADADCGTPEVTLVGTVGGSWSLVNRLFDGDWADLDGPSAGQQSGVLDPTTRTFDGAYTGSQTGTVGDALSTYDRDGRVLGNRDDGFVAGSWVRVAGRRGVYTVAYGDCANPVEDGFQTWYTGSPPPPPTFTTPTTAVLPGQERSVQLLHVQGDGTGPLTLEVEGCPAGTLHALDPSEAARVGTDGTVDFSGIDFRDTMTAPLATCGAPVTLPGDSATFPDGFVLFFEPDAGTTGQTAPFDLTLRDVAGQGTTQTHTFDLQPWVSVPTLTQDGSVVAGDTVDTLAQNGELLLDPYTRLGTSVMITRNGLSTLEVKLTHSMGVDLSDDGAWDDATFVRYYVGYSGGTSCELSHGGRSSYVPTFNLKGDGSWSEVAALVRAFEITCRAPATASVTLALEGQVPGPCPDFHPYPDPVFGIAEAEASGSCTRVITHQFDVVVTDD